MKTCVDILFFAKLFLPASLFTAGLFWLDKHLARIEARRISEKALLAASIVFGWPGAILSMHVFRHKTQKLSFKLSLAIVIVANLWLVWMMAGSGCK